MNAWAVPTWLKLVARWWRCACRLVLACAALPAFGAQEGDFQYQATGAGVEVTGYTGAGGTVVIPGHLGGMPVIGIGSNAFAGLSHLTNIAFPDSLSKISVAAFAGCAGLKSVVIPAGVTAVENSVFSGCSTLTNVVIPEGVASIGSWAFYSCTALPRIAMPDSVTNIGYWAFGGGLTLTNVEFGRGLRTIEDLAFSYCTKLAQVILPDGTESIGHYAFEACTNLSRLELGTNLALIGVHAFEGCVRLPAVTIPASMRRVRDFSFAGCVSLTGIYFEGDAPSLEGAVFEGSPFVTVFHRATASGWDATAQGRPTAVWMPRPEYNDWAVATGLAAQFPGAASAEDDPDGDGNNNGQEWFADTDPTLAGSRLVMELTPRPADLTASDLTPVPKGWHAFYFRSVPGRYYGLHATGGLGRGWTLRSVRVAEATQTRVLVAPDQSSMGFFRIIALP